jgi:two-component system vancomycin resistance associated response regulator VraR
VDICFIAFFNWEGRAKRLLGVCVEKVGGWIMKLRIVLFDAYTLALESIYDTIKTIHDFDIVGAFSNESEMQVCLRERTVDIVVLNLMLKSSEELEVIEKIKNIQSDVKIIVLIDPKDEFVYKRVLEIGVNAILSKDTSSSELISDIINVSKGNDIIPNFLISDNVTGLLSEVEEKVLRLMVNEYTNEEIAKELYISQRTVESHVTNILRKLGVNSRVGAVREAMKLKLV